MRTVTAALCLSLNGMWRIQPAFGQQATGGAKPAAPEKTGIEVGKKAPPIRLKDQTGKERSLEEWLHDGYVAVVFHRSASW
jgi:hypothetical protein